MLERVAPGSLRIALAVLALLSISFQLAKGISLDGFSIFNYLSYFSIIVGFIAAAVLLTYATATLSGRPEPGINDLRGATTLYLGGILIGTLATGGIAPDLLGWPAIILHYVLPIAFLVDWFADPPVEPPRFIDSLRWLIFPGIWVVYTLMRGLIDNWYPYPLIDVASYGYVRVIIYLVLATLVGVVIILLLTRLPQLYTGKLQRKPADVK